MPYYYYETPSDRRNIDGKNTTINKYSLFCNINKLFIILPLTSVLRIIIYPQQHAYRILIQINQFFHTQFARTICYE